MEILATVVIVSGALISSVSIHLVGIEFVLILFLLDDVCLVNLQLKLSYD